MSNCEFSKTLLPRYAQESKADWDYILQNAEVDALGSQRRLYRIADLALKASDMIVIGSDNLSTARPSGDY